METRNSHAIDVSAYFHAVVCMSRLNVCTTGRHACKKAPGSCARSTQPTGNFRHLSDDILRKELREELALVLVNKTIKKAQHN
jgi:hypothetical protein